MLFFFFFNDTATTEIYTLSLHDALPISSVFQRGDNVCRYAITSRRSRVLSAAKGGIRVPYRPFWITRSRSAVVGRKPNGVELNLKMPCRKSRGFGCDQRATSPAPSARAPWHWTQ